MGTILAAGDLSFFGCPMTFDFINSGKGTCLNHDGEEVVANDIGGKVKESGNNDRGVFHETMSNHRWCWHDIVA